MGLTVAQIEGVLLKRCGPAMGVVGMDATTNTGANADLADAIGYGVTMLGLAAASPLAVADGDVASLAGPRLAKLLDLAERRTLETVLNGYTFVDRQVDRDAQKKDQFRQGLRARIDALTARLSQPYGGGFPTMRIGRHEPRLRFPRAAGPGPCDPGQGGAT